MCPIRESELVLTKLCYVRKALDIWLVQNVQLGCGQSTLSVVLSRSLGQLVELVSGDCRLVGRIEPLS